jgi:hypothetical protein
VLWKYSESIAKKKANCNIEIKSLGKIKNYEGKPVINKMYEINSNIEILSVYFYYKRDNDPFF